MFNSTQDVITKFWTRLANYAPDFFAGLVILLVGLILSGVFKRILLTLLSFLKVDTILEKTRLITKKQVLLWEDILSEILRWTIVILFLIPTLEAWGLSQATNVLNQFLFYLPNVLVAVVIGFVGIIASNLVADLVRHSIKTLGSASANTLAVFAKSTLVFFTVLIIMNQLGVAQDLIRILFTGIVVMLALAGGLAFGLGGQTMAKELLEELKNKLITKK